MAVTAIVINQLLTVASRTDSIRYLYGYSARFDGESSILSLLFQRCNRGWKWPVVDVRIQGSGSSSFHIRCCIAHLVLVRCALVRTLVGATLLVAFTEPFGATRIIADLFGLDAGELMSLSTVISPSNGACISAGNCSFNAANHSGQFLSGSLARLTWLLAMIPVLLLICSPMISELMQSLDLDNGRDESMQLVPLSLVHNPLSFNYGTTIGVLIGSPRFG